MTLREKPNHQPSFLLWKIVVGLHATMIFALSRTERSEAEYREFLEAGTHVTDHGITAISYIGIVERDYMYVAMIEKTS